MSAPAFANKSNCYKCNQKFGMFGGKHHCRNCGQTVCQKCSTKTMPLKHFNIAEAVRVCDACHTEVNANLKAAAAPAAASSSASSSSSSIPAPAEKVAPAAAPVKQKKVKNCTCNMPLCICPEDEEEPEPKDDEPVKSSSSSSAAAASPAKARATPRKGGKATMFANSSRNKKKEYDLKGNLNEQCREAIKNSDEDGVRTLLDAGADAKYVDAQQNSLVHMAAMFNGLKIVEMLHVAGADMNTKNGQGETPMDLAPPALQFKMKSMGAKE